MDLLNLAWAWALVVAQPLALVLPVMLWSRISEAAHFHHPYGSWRPALATLAGVSLGLSMVVAMWEPGTLTFSAIFEAEGRWNLSVHDFWTLVMERLADGPHRLLEVLTTDDERWNYTVVVAVVAVLFALDSAITLVAGFRGPPLLAFLLDLTMAVLACGLTIYGIHAVLWLLNRLNFWVIAVAILLLQEYRYSVLHLFRRRRRSAPTGSNGQHGFTGKTKGS